MTLLVIAVILGLVRSGGAYDQGMGFSYGIYIVTAQLNLNMSWSLTL